MYLDDYNNTTERTVLNMTQSYIPKDAADYPKTSATQAAMVEIAQKYIDEYDSALKNCPKDNKMQKKVLLIQKTMSEHCGGFAMMEYASNTLSQQISRRENMLAKNTNLLQEYAGTISSLTEDERYAFILYAHVNWFLHYAFIDKHIAEFEATKANNQLERAFDDRIILGTMYLICREWHDWWRKNGTAPFDEWTYDDAIWDSLQSEVC